jgi:hypothetical protein
MEWASVVKRAVQKWLEKISEIINAYRLTNLVGDGLNIC